MKTWEEISFRFNFSGLIATLVEFIELVCLMVFIFPTFDGEVARYFDS